MRLLNSFCTINAEDLQENDKQMLALLRQRSKLIETLRTDKPQNWVTNQLEGRENVLNAMAAACEVSYHSEKRVFLSMLFP